MLPRSRMFGSVAEFVAVPPNRLALAPAGLDLVQAAALPAVGTTAITALRDKLRLTAGDRHVDSPYRVHGPARATAVRLRQPLQLDGGIHRTEDYPRRPRSP